VSGLATEKAFTPALGIPLLTPLYDLAIGLLTREDTWRTVILEQVAPTAKDRILDVGCGTGSLALRLKMLCAEADVHGIDPDIQILQRAQAKAKRESLPISFHQGFLTSQSVLDLGKFSKVVSSLVLHQTPFEEKSNILRSMAMLLLPNGRLCIADYGFQRTMLMRTLFRRTVQALDGIEDTQPNADGCIPDLMKAAGFTGVSELRVIPTLTGSISIYVAKLPGVRPS
jgi:ubiquinone/menaquinone biosynthesis C-methylase UbiE